MGEHPKHEPTPDPQNEPIVAYAADSRESFRQPEGPFMDLFKEKLRKESKKESGKLTKSSKSPQDDRSVKLSPRQAELHADE